MPLSLEVGYVVAGRRLGLVMAFVAPQYSRERVNSAGKTRLTKDASPEELESALGPINNWRAAHSFPLHTFTMTLRNRARKVDSNAVIAQRLKRLSSIEEKLSRYPGMKLTQIQDIGGCRAVLGTIAEVRALKLVYEGGHSKNPTGRHVFVHPDDYIAKPKMDGYRSLHLIYRYHSDSKDHLAFNDLKIEIQIRSKLQHAWATAVETVEVFTGQRLKAGRGDDNWKRFFVLMSNHIALAEKTAVVEGTVSDRKELRAELQGLETRLGVIQMLGMCRIGAKHLPLSGQHHFYLLSLDAEEGNVSAQGFTEQEAMQAQAAYAEMEKKIEGKPKAQAVLVSVDGISALRRAFPNYFLDTRDFLVELRRAVA